MTMLLAVALPKVAAIFLPYIALALMLMLFLNFMSVDIEAIKNEIFAWQYQLWLLFLTMILLPILLFFAATLLDHWLNINNDFALAILVIFACPTATAAPTLAILFGAKLERAILTTLTSSILVPLSMPSLIYILVGKASHIPILTFSFYIAKIIILPFILALIVRRVLPAVRTKLLPTVPLASLLLLVILIFAGASSMRSLLTEHSSLAIIGILCAASLFILVFGLSWLLAFKKDRASKLTASLVATWTNVGLSIIITTEFFHKTNPDMILYILMTAIVWNLAIIVAKMLINKNQN
ncbi:MAG: hypothetical protein JXR42_00360 [Gammaproteobacteria bacterium]|nr:hypothetical protein [Gammaproteobacteria bacterium]